jgi:hypothetical protein
MSIENATVTGWRPVTRQDLIDLMDGGEPPAARFRFTQSEPWRHDFLVGYGICAGRLQYAKRNSNIHWQICEIKTQVLRDPKFSDLDNGPIECMIYPDGGYECPQKGFLVGMTHKPTNKRNTTGMEYQTLWLYEKDKSYASVSHRWYVKVVDKSPDPIKATEPAPQAPEPEQTSTGWRSPTVEDLKDGPIECEVRDWEKEKWTVATLGRIDYRSEYPYKCFSCWKQCRIRVTEPAPQARYRQVDTGDEGKLVEFLDERTGSFIERTLLRFATRGGCMLPVDQDGCVYVYARIRR